jgi:hypothetical protein
MKSNISAGDYDAIISHARHLAEIDGWDWDEIFNYLESPWKWSAERETWLEARQQPREYDDALADSLRDRESMEAARRLK